jgi:methyltransferase-like protein/2-polyprenyl-3-methyl-5-hydroxy-6-metoxy-1,4-benzoquinol methylase
MVETALSSYEEVPYESKPLHPTHPDSLAAVATLLGMSPAPAPSCRVLELGCADGGNLIPLAEALPHSTFLGIDLSPRQVEAGKQTIAALGLTNVELRALSILALDDSFGAFDYLICHGVYSWVPAEVQDKILDICERNLAPQGVAYVSYNTYPGWHTRGLVRDLMGFHVRQFTEPEVRVGQARAFLDFLVRAVPEPESTYGRLLREEADTLRRQADYYLFHEHLEDLNRPVYFSEFMERAAAKGLQYLGEAWYHTTLSGLPAEVAETLQAISSDLIRLEQYVDFLRNRTFRRTLLCHAGVQLNREPTPQLLTNLHATALARPVEPEGNSSPTGAETFRADNGQSIATNIPVVKAALRCLFEAWPRALSFAGLWSAVQARLGPTTPEEGQRLLAGVLLECYLTNLVGLHVHPPEFLLEVSPRPVASPLARFQAATSAAITNRRHRLVSLSPFDRLVVQHLDGTRDRGALLDMLVELAERKVLTVDGTEQGEVRAALDTELTGSLERLAKSAVLLR